VTLDDVRHLGVLAAEQQAEGDVIGIARGSGEQRQELAHRLLKARQQLLLRLKPIPAVDQSLHVREELPDLGGERLRVRGRFPGQRRIELQEVDHAAGLEQLQVQLFLAAEEGCVQRQRGDRPLGGFAKAVDVQAAQLAQGANDRQQVFLQADDLHMSHPVGHASSSPPGGQGLQPSRRALPRTAARIRSTMAGRWERASAASAPACSRA